MGEQGYNLFYRTHYKDLDVAGVKKKEFFTREDLSFSFQGPSSAIITTVTATFLSS